jgi:hypothetical protein
MFSAHHSTQRIGRRYRFPEFVGCCLGDDSDLAGSSHLVPKSRNINPYILTDTQRTAILARLAESRDQGVFTPMDLFVEFVEGVSRRRVFNLASVAPEPQ